MAGRDTLVTDEVDFRDEWEPDDELPPRTRRRVLTPVGIGLLAIAALAGAFIAGVEVQKSSQPATSAAAAAGRFGGALPTAARAGGFGPGGGGGAAPTFGTVSNKHGGTLYVRSSSGTTLRVTTSHAKITRSASTGAKGIYPGDTVIVQGTTRSDGSISASQIRATAKGGGFGGFGGGAGFRGAPVAGGGPGG